MDCLHCGKSIDSAATDITVCPNCGQNPRVTVLGPEERENFTGLTINQKPEDDYDNSHREQRVFMRRINLNPLTALLMGGVFLLLVIMILPLALPIIFIALIIWTFARLIFR